MGFFTLISKIIVKTDLKDNLNSAHIKLKKLHVSLKMQLKTFNAF